VMERQIVARKRRLLTLRLSLLGLLTAAAFGAYFETDPNLEIPTAVWAATVSVVLCPGSLLFVTFIDAEPRTSGFLFMWLVIGLINIALYGAIGAIIGRFLWKSDRVATLGRRVSERR
jgi:hypothetical protein